MDHQLEEESSEFISSLKSKMYQLTDLFIQGLETEFKKLAIPPEEYKLQCKNLESKVSAMEQKLEQFEKIIRNQNTLILQIKDSQKRTGGSVARKRTNIGGAEIRNIRLQHRFDRRTSIVGGGAAINPNVGARTSPLAGVPAEPAAGTGSVVGAPQQNSGAQFLRTLEQQGTAAQRFSAVARMSTSGGRRIGLTLSPGRPKGPPEAAAKRVCYTLDTKFHVIEEIQSEIDKDIAQDAAIKVVASKYKSVEVRTLERWWEDREKIRRNWNDHPDARYKKNLRKSNAASAETSRVEDNSWMFDVFGEKLFGN